MKPEEEKALNKSIDAALSTRPEEYWLERKKGLEACRFAIEEMVKMGGATGAFERLKGEGIINSEVEAFTAGAAYASSVLQGIETALENRGY